MKLPFGGARGRHAAGHGPAAGSARRGFGGTRRQVAAIGFGTAALLVGAAVAASTASAAQTDGEIRDSGLAPVAGSYVVVLKDSAVSANDVGSRADGLARQYGGKVGHRYNRSVRGFEVRTTEAKAKKLAGNPAVAYVERNAVVKKSDTQNNPPSYGLDRIDQAALPLSLSYTYPNTAASVHAYIIDTGARLTHSDFGGRIVSGRDTIDNDNDATDCDGHGTHVAGTVGGTAHGVAKNIQMVAVRVLDCVGDGTLASVIAGVDWVTANAVKPAVANMSLGGGGSSTIDTAVRNSIASGVTYAVAAGNENGTDACTRSPARTPEAITVGSTTSTDARSSFSNIGTCLDLFAPGSSIRSAWLTDDTATNTISGTSMATPHVTGAAALLLQANPALTPQQIRDQLVNGATANVVSNPGSGSPNKLLFVGGTVQPPTDDFSVSVSPAAASVAPGSTATATVTTATTGGAAQQVTLSATGVPSGATASFNPSTVTSGGTSTLTVTTSASTPPGTYQIKIVGTGAVTRSATFTLTVTGGNPGSCSGSNTTPLAIPDAGAAVNSTITISGCGRSASSTSTVEVHVTHPFRGDLRVDLVAPDGSTYRLKSTSVFDGTDDINTTYTVNVGGEAGNGAWKLRLQDLYGQDSGTLTSWTLTL